MAAKPTLIYTWALSGLAVEPTVGKKASGWSVGERPPSATENWLNQANGAWINYLDGVIYDANTTTDGSPDVGPGLYLGPNRDAALYVEDTSISGDTALVRLLSDNYAECIFQPDAIRADKVRTGRLELNDSSGSNTDIARLELSSDSPESGLDTFVEFNTNGGNPCYVRAHAFSPLGTANDIFTANVMPLDRVVCRENFLKAWVAFTFTRVSAGAPTISVLSSYNVTSVTGPDEVFTVNVTDSAGGLIGYDLSITPRGVVGGAAFSAAADTPLLGASTFSAGILVSNAGVWDEIGDTATSQSVQVFVGIY